MAHVVFGIESADRFKLLGPPTSEGPTFKSIALSFIDAPKLAKRTATGEFGVEEPCAAEAAELMRTTFIGKAVRFTEDYKIDALQWHAGRVTLENGVDAASLLLQNGFATVPESIPPRMDKGLFEKYTALFREAKAAKKGLFAPKAAHRVRTLVNLTPEKVVMLGEKLKGKEVLVRVEEVALPTVLMVSAESFGPTHIAVHMPGVTVKDSNCMTVMDAAQFHTERYLLHRKVKVLFSGLDDLGNIQGSVTSSKGLFQVELLSHGFVKLDGSTLSLTNHADEFQAAEKTACSTQQGLWKQREEQKMGNTPIFNNGPSTEGIPVTNTNAKEGVEYKGPMIFTAVVIQIISGDTITVRPEENPAQTIRVSLAGVRSSKNVTREQDGRSPETRVTYNDCEWEAREFLRKHLIGKQVLVQVEYARQIAETKEIRPVAVVSIPHTGVNIGVLLLETGYATFSLGKNDKCSIASLLQTANETARTNAVGIYSKDELRSVKVVELSHLGSARGKYYLSFLQRGMQGNRPPILKGVVDVVIGGSSLRIYIPKERFQIPVKVAGIITPMGAVNGSGKSDHCADDSKRFAVNMLQQHEVEIQVHGVDKVGNFISTLFLQNGTNFAVATVEAGLGTVANAERLVYYQQLVDAEQRARTSKKYIWASESAIPQRAALLETERCFSKSKYTPSSGPEAEFAPYILSDVGEDGYSVYLQENNENMESTLETLEGLLSQVSVAGVDYHPKSGEVVVAQYKADKKWHRAKVLHSKKGEIITVLFVDFGTRSEVRAKHIRAIPNTPEFTLLRETKPLSRLVRLAFLRGKVTSADISTRHAYDTVCEYTEGPVIAKEMYRDGHGNAYYTITICENVSSLSETMLQRGVALLDRAVRQVDPTEYRRHEAAQEIARRGHKGMWRYGDIDEDSDEN